MSEGSGPTALLRSRSGRGAPQRPWISMARQISASVSSRGGWVFVSRERRGIRSAASPMTGRIAARPRARQISISDLSATTMAAKARSASEPVAAFGVSDRQAHTIRKAAAQRRYSMMRRVPAVAGASWNA